MGHKNDEHAFCFPERSNNDGWQVMTSEIFGRKAFNRNSNRIAIYADRAQFAVTNEEDFGETA